MQTWAMESAPDMRARATLVRLDNGDPTAGLRWAGFSAQDLAKGGAVAVTPGILFLANAVATSNDPKATTLRRRPNESLNDYADRLKAHAFATIPALKSHEEEIKEVIGAWGDVKGVSGRGAITVFHGANLTRVLVGNSVAQGALKSAKFKTAAFMRWLPMKYDWMPNELGGLGRAVQGWNPPIRSLAAPGTWLPSKLGALASGSATYQNASRIPFTRGLIGDQWSRLSASIRESRALTTPLRFGFTGNQAIDFLVGSDKVAKMYGGMTHSGVMPGSAGQASLWKVGRNSFKDSRLLGKGRLSSMGSGVKFAGRAGGFLRGAGVVGGVASTTYSAANVWAQGNPADHFDTREHGAKYVADVAEVGFNASLTAATVAPNPFTIGAVAVTDGVYVGAKVVEHWDDIKKGAGQAWKATGDAAKAVVKDPVGSAKKVGHALNPKNWF